MTTTQPILVLRHIYESAVQLCRTDSVRERSAPSAIWHRRRIGCRPGATEILQGIMRPNPVIEAGSSSKKRRLSKVITLEDDEDEDEDEVVEEEDEDFNMLRTGSAKGRSRSKSTGHFSTCCSQGKVRLPPPPQPNPEYRNLLEGSNSGQLLQAKAFRENARSALSCTSLAAHWDQTQVGTLGPPVFRVFGRLYHRLGALLPAVDQRPAFAQTWLIDPAEATDTRLGPDGADSRMQRSTLTKLDSILRTGNRFVREFASAKARAGRDRRTHNLPTSSTEMAMLICKSDTNTGDREPQDRILQVHGDRCPDGRPKYQVVSSLHPSAMPLRYPLLFPAGDDGFHLNIPLCGFHQAGPPIARNREQIDNGVQLREVLAGLGLDDEDEEEDEDRDDEDEDSEEGEGKHQEDRLEVDQPESCVPNSLHTTFTNAATISHSRVRPGVSFSRFVIDGYSQVETDRLNSIRLHQENLRLTTAQGIAEAVANGLTPDQMGRSVIFGLDQR
ncbi:BZ3500_MvSof-1268-A1-R1_Chr11-3g03577 [Microbotryum saponariae]|uniref:BZ3500_MvSof-1268-A1-R1_Chr11-3g03577 protein n=1 Tax=Microbotryum saponariae TaxID=289078 RepID=A0A2X0NE35_9BASI|nr:BZ3500_MvSof-1268-A1-R1_Chr11-3g03577 [Microbotryum saponariae]SDA03586.1 BZ3501_MvSof-1269-A2-R1_Chr11g03154 [Microbotryum saponariae]